MRGVTFMIGAERGRVDDSRPEGPGKEISVVSNFLQETQHAVLPHQTRALPNGVRESTFELPSNGRKALLDHDGGSQHAPVIVLANCRHLVERTVE